MPRPWWPSLTILVARTTDRTMVPATDRTIVFQGPPPVGRVQDEISRGSFAPNRPALDDLVIGDVGGVTDDRLQPIRVGSGEVASHASGAAVSRQ